MPTVNDILAKKSKFKKSSYRPWNYMDEIEKEQQEMSLNNNNENGKVSNKNETGIKEVSNGYQKDIKKESPPSITDNYKTSTIIKVTEEKRNKTDAKDITTLCNVLNEQLNTDSNRAKEIFNNTLSDATKIIEKNNIKRKSKPIENLETKEGSAHILDLLFQLSGHQKTIFLFIIERCLSRGQLSTGAVHRSVLKDIAKTTIGMVKTTYTRLEEKKLIFREEGKTGRGGYCRFSITEVIRDAALTFKSMLERELKEESKGYQTGVKGISNGYQTDIDKVYDSSNSTSKDFHSLPPEWQNISIDESIKSIGFSEKQLMHLYLSKKQRPEIVQDSLDQFSFGLKNNGDAKKYKEKALNVIMGVLNTGKAWSEKNYKSPNEIAIEQYLTRKKEEKERIKKLEDEIIECEFEEWLQNINEIQRNEIVGELNLPSYITDKMIEGTINARLKEHFINNIKSKSEKL